MTTFEFTIPMHSDAASDFLQQSLEKIAQNRYSVRITSMPWETVWSDLVNVGLHKTGADVSEAGTTWIGGFVAMNALRPFSGAEINRMGGQSAFAAPAWRSAAILGDEKIWAIPWMADARVIYYWRDMFEKSAVDANTAFQTPDNMAAAFDRVRASLSVYPWATTTRLSRDTLFNSLSWVWGAGGDIVSADGTRPTFHEPEARAGFRNYFNLHRFLPPEPALLTDAQTLELFRSRQAAATMSGPWLFNFMRNDPEASAHLAVALPPGPSFVGGLNLIIWNHIQPALAPTAVEIVLRLATGPDQAQYCEHAGFLPARLDLLAQPPFSTEPRYQIFAQALEHGRSHNPITRWGLIEDRLTSTLSSVWADIRNDPAQDLDSLIVRHVEPLAKRLEMTLQVR